MKKVLAAARAALGADPTLDHPRQPLEPYFLNVIEAASRDSSSPASGAVPAAPLAPFLRR